MRKSEANGTYQIILSRLGVSNNNKHFVIHVFVWDGVAVAVSRCVRHDRIVLNLELAYKLSECLVLPRSVLVLTILLSYNDHGLGCFINVFWLCPNGHKFNIITNSQNFTTSLSFDVFLGNILGFVIEKTMRVSRPGDTPHVDFVFLLPIFELVLQAGLQLGGVGGLLLGGCFLVISWAARESVS